ncbi:DEAD/DEAH box helicase [Alysiella filiformis]|uniref:DEAD-box ATP-dependent RNA helicase RhpA n=1 Tax=Alysiella filiformis DSM 16848 TaxID=1120981 RepID=A0A286EDU2_9NEIS|nr:DEAD/DEAH box helicase [Alysiella filiformis]QMT31683.1 DEAD/DEAH box helicase [Alysiella filiformis]UBQ55308.1 DEAD/DEAH box helicase [Alysiella filiformis DSM 16848]SOD69073.1 Superfamily II DNA and RNA helicase [Alysiella filiformis DSM 16848]
MSQLFSELGLSNEIIAALTEQGYHTPTPIQAAAIPKALAGHDLLAAAQTGTGKTAAFMLPSLERLKRYANSSTSPAMHPVRMLVLTPTRELALQIEQNARQYKKNLPLRHVVLFGGVNMDKQTQDLRAGCEIVIATVGRLLDHVKQKHINLNKVEIVVLDEADRMLDMGFIDDIRNIMQMLPRQRQTLLFSATFAPAIRKLAQDFMHAPEVVEVAAQNTTNANVEQHVIAVDAYRKRDLLERLIVDLHMTQVIVFCKTKQSADQVARDLVRRGLSANAIHGDKSQQTRLDVLNQFKSGSLRVLVATDVAARGLDIAELPFVVNYELPVQAEDYVHRIGRTGRAGADGIAISMMDENEQKMYQSIQELIQTELPISRIEGFEPRWQQGENAVSGSLNESAPPAKHSKTPHQHQPKPHKSTPPALSVKTPPPPISSRRRGRERRTCALLQRHFGAE